MIIATKRQGFTLIEGAIVIAVIGLLIGGVMLGTSMMHQAKVRAALGELNRYAGAVQAFQSKYAALPGDYANARAALGASTEGNGDTRIGTCCYGDTGEWYAAWEHLARANLIEGNYIGTLDNSSAGALLGRSVPASSIPLGGYTMLYAYNDTGALGAFPFTARHVIELGGVPAACVGGAAANCITRAPLITPQDAAEMDTKMDDGRPGTGMILSWPQGSGVAPDCVTTTDPATAVYDVNNTNARCSLIISLGY